MIIRYQICIQLYATQDKAHRTSCTRETPHESIQGNLAGTTAEQLEDPHTDIHTNKVWTDREGFYEGEASSHLQKMCHDSGAAFNSNIQLATNKE